MMNINATQFAGLLSFGVAAAFCYRAWRATRQETHLWAFVSLLYVLIAADTVLGARYHVSNLIRAALRYLEVYQDRRLWQAVIVICLMGLIWGLLRAGFHAGRHQEKNMLQAISLSLLAPVFFALEVTSLHGVDAVLYHRAGPLLVIGWIWVALAALTVMQACRVPSKHFGFKWEGRKVKKGWERSDQ